MRVRSNETIEFKQAWADILNIESEVFSKRHNGRPQSKSGSFYVLSYLLFSMEFFLLRAQPVLFLFFILKIKIIDEVFYDK